MTYFFGNERNEKGLCATPHCTRKPTQTFVYRYCEECFATIVSDLAAGRVSNAAQIEKPGSSAGNVAAELQEDSSRPAAV